MFNPANGTILWTKVGTSQNAEAGFSGSSHSTNNHQFLHELADFGRATGAKISRAGHSFGRFPAIHRGNTRGYILVKGKQIIFIYSNSIPRRLCPHSQFISQFGAIPLLISIWRTALASSCVVNSIPMDLGLFKSTVINQMPATHCKNGLKKLIRNLADPVAFIFFPI